jgi:hypothetical protein
MDTTRPTAGTSTQGRRYARCIEASRRIRWEIDRDVIRGRTLEFTRKFLPDSLSRVRDLPFLTAGERRFVSQVQGRTYANMFGLVERFIGAKILEVSRDHWLGDQTALEALVRFTDEELKHQELFRRLDRMMEEGMPAGYSFVARPNDVAAAVLGKSTWAVLGLTCLIELFTQAHYRSSIEPDPDLSPLWKDVFLFHWKEESQHAILDELEWLRADAALTRAGRDQGVSDLIDLVAAVDGLLREQAAADTAYFLTVSPRRWNGPERDALGATFLRAYRWQYILSGTRIPRFQEVLGGMINADQSRRIGAALAPLVDEALAAA